MSTPAEQTVQIEQARLELDRQRHADEQRLAEARLELERARQLLDSRFVTKHLGTFVTAVVSLAAVVVSVSQVYIASQSKQNELELAERSRRRELEVAERAGVEQRELTRAQQLRDWNVKAAEFIVSHEEIVFSQSSEKRQLFASLLIAAFPPPVTSSVVERLAAGASTATEKSLWTGVSGIATELSFRSIDGPSGGDGTGGWMSSGAYVQEFTRQRDRGLYPSRVEGRSQNGIEEFRADFKPSPPGVSWQSYHWMTKADYDRRHSDLTGQGYSRESVETFTDGSGTARYLATWTRRQ